jgi:hypothetical protein
VFFWVGKPYVRKNIICAFVNLNGFRHTYLASLNLLR